MEYNRTIIEDPTTGTCNVIPFGTGGATTRIPTDLGSDRGAALVA